MGFWDNLFGGKKQILQTLQCHILIRYLAKLGVILIPILMQVSNHCHNYKVNTVAF